MQGLDKILSLVAQAAEKSGVRWYVFGAQAVAAHGVPRATQDLDITALCDGPALEAFVAALAGQNFEHRFPEIADELMRNGSVVPLRHAPTGFDVDLVIGGTELETLALARAEVLVIAGVPVPVCCPTDLAIGKAIAGRPIDLEDIRGLLAGGRVDVAEVRRTLRAVERAVGEDGMLARFNALVPLNLRP